MQKVDEETIARVCPGIELMERAGRGCAEVIVHAYGEDSGKPSKAVIFAGSGNNGGDGLVIARHLAESGWGVSVHLLKPGKELSPDAAKNHQRLRDVSADLQVTLFDATRPDWVVETQGDLVDADVVVDAIFGTGIAGAPRGVALDAIRLINEQTAPVVSIDIPSGVAGSTGETPGEAVIAGETLTIGAPKVGVLFHPGKQHCAEVSVIDIGFPDDIIEKHSGRLHLLDLVEAASRMPFRPPDTHKFDAGTLVVVAGSAQYRGAALLCAEAALRGGAGMVYLGVPESIRAEVDVALREAITIGLPETPAGTVSTAAVDVLAPFLDRAHALAVGPGIGRDEETACFVEALLRATPLPTVIDADAINAFAGRADALAAIADQTPLVLTPHSGELGVLLGDDVPEGTLERVALTEEIAARLGATLLHKGAPTLVGGADEGVFVATAGSSSLATGGTGDVLTGFVGSFLAQGAEPLDAALAACHLHGKAGDLAAEDLGKRGVIASDLLWAFGHVMVELEALTGD